MKMQTLSSYTENSEQRKANMQNFASQVFSYMAHGCTAPKIPIVEPTSTFTLDEDFGTQGEGYKWPHYSYTRGYVQTISGRDRVIAVPADDLSREFPDDFIVAHSSG
jgi:hypothetical protein